MYFSANATDQTRTSYFVISSFLAGSYIHEIEERTLLRKADPKVPYSFLGEYPAVGYNVSSQVFQARKGFNDNWNCVCILEGAEGCQIFSDFLVDLVGGGVATPMSQRDEVIREVIYVGVCINQYRDKSSLLVLL